MGDKEADPDVAVAVVPQSTPTLTGKTPQPCKGKKRRVSVNPLRVVLFLFRRHANAGGKDTLHQRVVKSGSRGLWKTLAATMCLLHHHHAPETLETQAHIPVPTSAAMSAKHRSVPFVSAPSSPAPSAGGMSSYSSADDLQALDTDKRDEEEQRDGQHTIDAKAEEFIAKFYEQIRLQRLQATEGD